MGKKLYVGNLNFRTTDDSLAAAFVAKGFAVVSAKVITDRETGRSRGFAFVEMESDEAASQALSSMHDHDVEGRPIKVTEARAKEGGGGGGGFRGGDSRGGYGGPPRGGDSRGGFGGPPRSGGFGDSRGRDDRPARSDGPRFGGRDAERAGPPGGGRFGDSRGGPRMGGGGFGAMPPGGPTAFPPTEDTQSGRRGRGERRDLRKQHERREEHEDDDEY